MPVSLTCLLGMFAALGAALVLLIVGQYLLIPVLTWTGG